MRANRVKRLKPAAGSRSSMRDKEANSIGSSRPKIRLLMSAATVSCVIAAFLASAADAPSSASAEFAKHAEKAYQAAKTRYETETNNPEAIWKFGQACFDWADFSTSDDKREEIANQGIAACRKLIARNPKSAEGHYYLGMDLGQLAQTKELGALKIVKEMEAEFKIVLGLNPDLDYAGAERNLGLLYRDCPGWPASIGNKAKARQYLQKALRRAPGSPENFLNLIEGEIKWGDNSDAARELKSLDKLWPEARKKFTGEEWGASWADWEKRRDSAQKKTGQAARVIDPPRKP